MRQQRIHRFMLALATVGGIVGIWLAAWIAGLTPASAEEREFIDMARRSVFASAPGVSAALQVTGDARYVSRRHFLAVAEAVSRPVEIGSRK